MIDPRSRTILEVLKNDANARIVIPIYQRNFSWGKDEAQEFIEDIKSRMGRIDNRLFLGTFIFDRSSVNKGEIKVVDGQQRITTISLLLIACRTLAGKLGNKDIASAIQEKITFKDEVSGESSGSRILVSPSIKEIFDYICLPDWDGNFIDRSNGRSIKRQVNKVKPIYDFFLKQISDFNLDDLKKFLEALYGAYVVKIDISDESEAFEIFERMNARGVALDAADLLKNYLFANSSTSDLEEFWGGIVEKADETILRMLKYFYVSRLGYVSKSDLYKRIKDYGDQIGIDQLVNELQEFSSFYWVMRRGGENDLTDFLLLAKCPEIANKDYTAGALLSRIEAFRTFGIAQPYPVIYSAVKACSRDASEKNVKAFHSLIAALENYHFVNNVVCDRIGNDVEKLYADQAISLFQTEDFCKAVDNLIIELRKKLASREEFLSRFADISYSSENIPLICYIFDRKNNFDLPQGGWKRLFNVNKNYLKKSFNVEHFMPQKPATKVDDETMSYIDNIGNLLVIEMHSNSSLGNKSPQEKIEILSDQKYIQSARYLADFVKEVSGKTSSWNKEEILKRAKSLAEEAYTKIWKIK